jgi:tRNA (Thr-GGU) A37 N-methylase
MSSDPYGLRPGEVAIELPEDFDAGVYFVGRIHTPWQRREECPKNARESDAGHYDTQRGTFALRSPVRPNPIAASVVKLVEVDGPRLSVVGLDCLDGTPLIDIKPYFASVDAVPDAVVGWHAQGKT